MPLKAIQQFMLGTVLNNEEQARETLTDLKSSGYDGIELCSFMIHKTPPIVRLMTKAAGMPVGKCGGLDWHRLVKESGLKVISLHTDLGSIERDPAAIASDVRSFDTDKAVITGMYRFAYADNSEVHQLAERLNHAGEALKKEGVQLLYHNHNCELLRVNGDQRAYDILIDETDPELVNFEFDSYWFADGGSDPIFWMKKLGTRMKLWHINDRGTRLSGPAMTPILTSDSLELGTGNMPLDELLAQAQSVGVDAIILESHRNWINNSARDSYRLSAKYLNENL